MESARPRNRLALESSAYLLQHAANPVDWFPWGPEALEKARQRNRPILVSIGYSACHWCHVMERECFEDESIAALMNANFVCIKVDREERPDLDHVYMKALQGMVGRGGWPLTMFLTPDARPFYGGTYFPPEDRGGLPGFPRVLLGVSKTWREQASEVTRSADRIVAFLQEETSANPGREVALSVAQLADSAAALLGTMDREHGGFGHAPKFPSTMALEFLLEAGPAGVDEALSMVRLSLDRMASGGMRDHLGGGFHRYSVDARWVVPHFEKMLYDQALMASTYAAGARQLADRKYAAVAAEALDYVLRELRSPSGTFHSSQDADTDGEEGVFYLWTHDEILALLGPEQTAVFQGTYPLSVEGNFEGRSVLVRRRGDVGGPLEDVDLAASRALLLRHRAERTTPAIDRKVVVDWNGLAISALVAVGSLLDRDAFIEAAEAAVGTIAAPLFESGFLPHAMGSGDSSIRAFLDDYAFFGRACLDLFAVRPRRPWLEAAMLCASRLREEFRDPQTGGFRFSGACNETLISPVAGSRDGAVPAGNSVAAELLFRLWALTGDDEYRRGGQEVLDHFLAEALRSPQGSCHLLCVAERCARGWRTVVIVGDALARAALARVARANLDSASIVVELESPDEDWYPATLRGKTPPPTGALAYVCDGMTCQVPAATEDDLRKVLEMERVAVETERRGTR